MEQSGSLTPLPTSLPLRSRREGLNGYHWSEMIVRGRRVRGWVLMSRLCSLRCSLWLVALVLTLSPDALAFRSGSDLAELDRQPHVAFATPKIELTLYQDVAPGLDLKLVEADVKLAANTWAAPACTNVSFSYIGTTAEPATAGDGHNTVQWVSDWKTRGFPPDSPGITDVQYAKDGKGRWTIAEADTYLNLDFDWTTAVPTDTRRSLLAVLTHELGHVLGLLHPCEVDGTDGAPKCSTSAALSSEEMYPLYSPGQTVLSDDDIGGVCYLYSPVCDDSTCNAGSKCVAGRCQLLCGDVVCDGNTVCNDGKCVAPSKDCGDDAGCVGQACTDQFNCGPHEFCDGSVCARGDRALGDLCSSAKQCLDGACVNGACAQSCSPFEICASGGKCIAETGACTDSLAPMGESCRFSTDCRGSYCLTEDGRAPVCTRSCAAGQPSCPSGWGCRHADGALVCAPSPAANAGCSLASAPLPISPSPYGLALAALFCTFRRVSQRASFRKLRS